MTEPAPGPSIVAEDPRMREVLGLIEKVGDSDSPVLVTGESGTGKSLVARVLHERGPRAGGPWVEVACANITGELMESEIFGHERGAYSGASERRLGKFEMADGGTLFIDQVAELAPPLQAKFLRVLEHGAFERLGGNQTIQVNVRVVASTSHRVKDLVARGIFRKDLFYRLSVFQIEVPALRDRPGDILPLARLFLRKYARLYGRPARRFHPEVPHLLREYGWPGNVRELENVVERGVIVCQGGEVEPEHLPLQQILREEDLVARATRTRMSLADLEAAYIRQVLRLTAGNKSEAARILGIHRKTLLEKRKRYGID
jgi:two-component system NtrC family response regulator